MAPREHDDAMAGLLKRSLAGDAGAGNDCPGPEILAAYFERSLAADETARMDRHLSGCVRCREELAALARAEAEAPATSIADARRKAPRASWIWDWRWLAPVAAVLVITAIWATRRPALTQITNHAGQPPASVAPSQLKQSGPSASAPGKTIPLRAAPAPAHPHEPPKLPPQKDSGAANPVDREKSGDVGRSPLANLQSQNSARDLPPAIRDYSQLDSVSKKAAEPPIKSAERAPNAPPAAKDESATVESRAEIVQPSPAGAPTPTKAENGPLVGAVGGAIGPATADAKQERAAENRLRMAQVAELTQEQRAAGFTVQTPDTNVLWHIRDSGFIERSVDGGATWHGTLPKQNAHYIAGSAPSANILWLVGRNGVVLLTQDGSHWQTIAPPQQTDFVGVTARDAWSATVTAADGRRFSTSNQGADWTGAK
ncbi:MAG TPA: zf-HC2 domain-containing protein [Candidatus Acidoferrales bacterium]|nr:zf-HC2 domain-containing protein [Candidatus Acidoferrales bacterium]